MLPENPFSAVVKVAREIIPTDKQQERIHLKHCLEKNH